MSNHLSHYCMGNPCKICYAHEFLNSAYAPRPLFEFQMLQLPNVFCNYLDPSVKELILAIFEKGLNEHHQIKILSNISVKELESAKSIVPLN